MSLTIDVLEATLADTDLAARRQQLGVALLHALDADAFISFVRDDDGPFADPLVINLGSDHVRSYERYYRTVDNLTPRLCAIGGAVQVDIRASTNDEFEHDFLLAYDLQHGMNFHAPHGSIGSVDLRVWRSSRGGAFSADAVRTLDAVGNVVQRLWASDSNPAGFDRLTALLTQREMQIAQLVAQGHSDLEMCRELHIAHSTLRTHLTHIFAKTSTPNRAALAALVAQYRQF